MEEAEEKFMLKIRKNSNFDRIALFLRWSISDQGISLITPALLWMTTSQKAMFVFFSMAFSEIFNGILKWSLQRPRPFWKNSRIPNIPGSFEGDFSAPSSHSQIISTICTAIFIKYQIPFFFQVFLISLVFFVGFTRVYLGVHYPSDVFLGWFFGILIPLFLEHVDIVEFYVTLDFTKRCILIMLVPIIFYGVLALIREIFPENPPSVVREWEKRANAGSRTEKRISPRNLEKYHFQIWGIVGSMIGTSLAMDDGKLIFIFEECSISDFPLAFRRYFLCMIVTAGLLFPGMFILPVKISDNLPSYPTFRKFLSNFVKIFFCFLVGYWLHYGCPQTAGKFGYQCPLFDFNQQLAGRFSVNESLTETNCILSTYPKRVNPNLEVTVVTSVKHLQEVILDTVMKEKTLKVLGAGHSQIFQQQIPEKDRGDQIRFISLRHPSFQIYKKLSIEGRIFVSAGAGLFLGENLEFGAKWEDSLVYKLWKDGLALPNLPGVTFQTVGGLILTGSEGGSLKYSLLDSIKGFKYVNGRGNVRAVWINDTSPDDFRAFGVSMGLAGVLTDVIFEPVPAYCSRIKMAGEQHKFLFQKNSVASWMSHDFFRCLWFPFLKNGKSEGFTEPTSFDHSPALKKNGKYICPGENSENPFILGNRVHQLMWSIFGSFITQPQCFKTSWEKIRRSELISELEVTVRNFPEDHRVFSELCFKRLKDLDFEKLYNNGLELETFLPCEGYSSFPPYEPVGLDIYNATKFVGPYFRIIPVDQSINTTLMQVALTELLIPIKSPEEAEEILEGFSLFLHRNPQVFPTGAAFLEIYFSRSSQFWMRDINSDILRVNIFALERFKDIYSRVFSPIWEYFHEKEIPFSLHWGKYIPNRLYHKKILTKAKTYLPNLKKWKKFVEREDPNHIFLDKYWREIFWE